MQLFDDKIRVEINSHGGMVFHFPRFKVWNTLGDGWAVSRESGGEPFVVVPSLLEAYLKGVEECVTNV